MFTGCIDHCGHLVKIENLASGKRFHISSQYTDLKLGESVAVNGVCLSVTELNGDEFTADVSPETLKISHFSDLQTGSLINLERSLRINERINGHFVLGHVDSTVALAKKTLHDDFLEYSFDLHDYQGRNFLVKKGCIALNGVSLTLNEVADQLFTVMLIPDTLAKTNLFALQIGEHVNIEYDYLAKLTLNKR